MRSAHRFSLAGSGPASIETRRPAGAPDTTA